MQIVPKGVFSDIPKLKTCDLSHNSIKSLPEDVCALGCVCDWPAQPPTVTLCVAARPQNANEQQLTRQDPQVGSAGLTTGFGCCCRELDAFILHHNCLAALPLSLFTLTALKTLDASYNRLAVLRHEIGFMEGLQVQRPTALPGHCAAASSAASRLACHGARADAYARPISDGGRP